MITIDGAQMSGSGTIVRHAVALAALLGRPVRIINARQRRREPGLRQQHVMSVHACAALCGATVDGVHVGSHAFDCAPGSHIAGGSFEWDIGTAGSATMLALSVLPVAYFAAAPVRARITGGLFQDFASSPFHMQRVLAPRLRSMGADVSLEMKRPGYAPGGGGIIELSVSPSRQGLNALHLSAPGGASVVNGIALSSHLSERRVSERMASACEEQIRGAGMSCAIDRASDATAVHAGACLAIWAKASTGGWFGADRAGKFGRSSEEINMSRFKGWRAEPLTDRAALCREATRAAGQFVRVQADGGGSVQRISSGASNSCGSAGTTRIWLCTRRIPGALPAPRSAASRCDQDATVPVRVTTSPVTATSM